MNIIKNRFKFFAVSVILIICGIAAMVINTSKGNGIFNFDIEFTGGTEITAHVGDTDNDMIADIVKEVTGQSNPQVQKLIGTENATIKMQSVEGEKRTELVNTLKEKLSLDDDVILSVQDISGTISGEMQKTAAIAVIIACIAMLIYITIRFMNLKMGISAIVALVHDVLIMLAFYAIFRIPVNNSFIAALLTVLGYSINATIVVFDRIRENKKRMTRSGIEEVINKSILQTMRRSIYTSITTIFAIGAVYVFGVQSVREFALPMMVGIISGAYSSVFLAGSVWYTLTGGKRS